MKRPLLWALVFMSAGIVFSAYLSEIESFAIGQYNGSFVCITFFFLIVIFISIGLHNRYRWLPVFLFPLFCLLGYLRYTDSILPSHQAAENMALAHTLVTLEGVVLDQSYTSTGRVRITLQTDAVKHEKVEPEAMSMRVMAILPEGEDANIGRYISLQGTLAPLDRLRNPGGFNEYAYYHPRGISYKLYPSTVRIGEQKMNTVVLLNMIKNRLANVLDTAFLPNEAAVIKSIVIGDKSDLGEEIKELYRIGGIYHVLAISGLHISILALAVRSMLSMVCRKRTSGLITFIGLTLYCLMTGASPSTVRALIMCGVIIAGELLYRDSDLLSSTSFACMCILLVQPAFIMDAGFQFSFSAVFGLAVLAPPFERGLILAAGKLPFLLPLIKSTKIRSLLAGNLAALLATYPVLSFHFYYLTPYSFLVNLLILPTMSALVVIGFAVALAGLVSTAAAVFLAGSATFILRYYVVVCSFFAELPFARLLTGSCGLATCVFAYAALLSMAYWLHGAGEAFHKRKKYFFCACMALIAIISIKRYIPIGFTITMLDVGQGDCFVIHDGQQTFIIDGGGLYGRMPGANTGATVLVPYLDYMGIGMVDGVFVTHLDNDHAIGITELITHKETKHIFLSQETYAWGGQNNSQLLDELINQSKQYKIPLTTLSKEDGFTTGHLSFDILYPVSTPTKAASNEAGSNETSLVIKLSYGNTDFLFTGDIGEQAEAYLLESGTDVSADVLKLAHHGSRYSNSENFLLAVNPVAAIVSAGRNNAYGHPSQQVLESLNKLGIPVYGTMEAGAVTIQVKGNALQVSGMRD